MFTDHPASPAAAGAPPGVAAARPLRRWRFTTVGAEIRPAVESFIAAGFLKAYGARLTEFMPELVALHDDGALAAACGLRSAAGTPLFLEQYLDVPVERVLGNAGADRYTITEVGNLSIARPGYARHLVAGLTRLLHERGMHWALFSAVPALRNNFWRLGIPMTDLGPADPARLSATARANWGSYYLQRPQITAVHVATAFRVLSGRP